MTHSHSSMRRRTALVLATIAAVLAGSAVGAGPASAASKATPKISAKVSAASVVTGQQVTLSGKVTKVKAPVKITISRKVGSSWRAVTSTKTAKSGTFSYRFAPPVGRQVFRVQLKATKKLKAATSKSVTVTVTVTTPAPPVVVPPVVPPVPPVDPDALPDDVMTLVSRGVTGRAAHGGSAEASISANGRYIAFSSAADDVVPGEPGYVEIYLRDRVAGTTTRVTTNIDGGPSNAFSFQPSISSNGRYVAFVSFATDLVPGGVLGERNVFVWDRESETTTLVSTRIGETAGGAVDMFNPEVSDDGNYVSFGSRASDIVMSDSTSDADVFLWDRHSGTNQLVSKSPDGGATDFEGLAGGLSADGRYVTFSAAQDDSGTSATSSAAGVFVWDRVNDATIALPRAVGDGGQDLNFWDRMSDDGNHVLFWSLEPLDGGQPEYYLSMWDRAAGTTTRLPVTLDGGPIKGDIGFPDLSADGGVVIFASDAANLVGDVGDVTNVFAWNRSTGVTTLVSANPAGKPASASFVGGSVSGNGKWAAFISSASDLVADDDNGAADVFVRNRLAVP